MIFLNFYHTMIIKKLTLTNNPKSSKYGRLVSEWRRLMATWGPLPPRPPTKSVHPTYKIWSSDLWNMCQCIQTIHKVLIQHTNCAFNQQKFIRPAQSVHPTYKMCVSDPKGVYPTFNSLRAFEFDFQKLCIRPTRVCASDLHWFVCNQNIDPMASIVA